MRFVVILPFCLLIILVNLRHTTAERCVCECCTSSSGCRPTFAGYQDLLWCSESATCRKSECSTWHPDKCPSGTGVGEIRAICPVSASERLLPTLLIVIGMNLIIRLIKDKF